MTTKFILVDLDGVLRHWPVDNNAIEKRYSLPQNALHDTAFSDTLLLPAVRGEFTDSEWRSAVSEQLKLRHPRADVEKAIAEWSESVGIIDPDVLQLLMSYQPVKLALVTNATSRLMSDLRALGIDKSFDNIFNSSDIGYIKPEIELFKEILDSLRVCPNEVLFIDDSFDNVEAAHQLGINSLQFTDRTGLRDFLATSVDR